MRKRIFIIAGEPSGDMHGSNLAKALKEQSPEVELFGLGGEKMRASGVELFHDIKDLAVFGLIDVLKKYKKFKSVFELILKKLEALKPDLLVPIDYPGFNLRLAREAKRRNVPVIYYISPQVWAWGGERVKSIKEVVDKMVVIFKFEEELYNKQGVDVSFVGHPLLDIARPQMQKEEAIKEFSLSRDKFTLGLLPGSRESEVKRLLPVMLNAACRIKEVLGRDIQVLIMKTPNLPQELFDEALSRSGVETHILIDHTYDGLNISDFALVCSGTATLETAIMQKPMVILYKVSPLSWFSLRHIVKIPDIGLANVVAGKRVVPELLQRDATPEKIAAEAAAILQDHKRVEEIKRELAIIKEKLGSPGASSRAAKIILGK